MLNKVIALAGNPNVGKSTIFNTLTGLHQHTGNWPGKTVSNTSGFFSKNNIKYKIFDLPGTYSLHAHSLEEQLARDFICFSEYDSVIVVCDALCLLRNLNLVIQICEVTDNIIICVNLMDEAKKKRFDVDLKRLSEILNIRVVGMSARENIGFEDLINSLENTDFNNKKSFKVKYSEDIETAISIIEKGIKNHNTKLPKRFISLNILKNNDDFTKQLIKKEGIDLNNEIIKRQILIAKTYLKTKHINIDELDEYIVKSLNDASEKIYRQVVKINNKKYRDKTKKIDKILTNKLTGIPIMILLLGLIFWITIIGSNYPSAYLQKILLSFENPLYNILRYFKIPIVLCDLLSHGMYRVLAWVVSVMGPPMAIFFPLFTFLEDIGYLPRIAFNVDSLFKKCRTCGKQALTMAMGFGCNAVGVTGCRIIDSPRERLIAIITNSFVPCNGRFPILISMISMFFINKNRGLFSSISSVLLLLTIICLGFLMTFIISLLLSKTILKGIPSSFTLELPEYRKPKISKIIVRSLFDRTLFILGRAISVAVPSGIIIWLFSNTSISGNSLLSIISNTIDPFARIIGMDGTILLAFILGFPANEIVIPIIIMGYLSTTKLINITDLSSLKQLFINNGWTYKTAICVMLFTLFHWPCSTTCLTIKKETMSLKWTIASVIIPALCGITLCFLVNLLF